MNAQTAAMLGILAVAILLCRPWLEARWPIASVALILGVAIGRVGATPAADGARSALAPAMALSAGWLALVAAEPWRMRAFHRTLPRSAWPALLAPAAALGAIGWLAGPGLALPLACLALAADPEAARHLLSRAPRPDPAVRRAPTAAAIGLGLALLLSALLPIAMPPIALLSGALPPGGAEGGLGGPARAILTLPAGAAIGLIFAILTRLAQGRAVLVGLLIGLPLLGWGLASWLAMSPLAVIFAAGLVLANDGARRDLVFTALRDLDRPFRILLAAVCGAVLAGAAAGPEGPLPGMLIVALAVVRPVTWALAGASAGSALRAAPLSPLALPLALGLSVGAAPGAVGVAAGWAFVLGEAAWLWAARGRVSS